MKRIGILAWYSGLASQSDFKRVRFDTWMRQFEDPDVVREKDKEALNEGKELWANLMKNSEKLS